MIARPEWLEIGGDVQLTESRLIRGIDEAEVCDDVTRVCFRTFALRCLDGIQCFSNCPVTERMNVYLKTPGVECRHCIGKLVRRNLQLAIVVGGSHVRMQYCRGTLHENAV